MHTGTTDAGLTPQQVLQARKQHGSNALSKKEQRGFFKQYLASFADPIIRILLIALGINLVFLFSNSFSLFEPVGIAIAILIATLISTLSEYSNQAAFAKLQADAARISCRVKRNGAVTEIPIDDIVVGDIVLLQAGERVPADGTVLKGTMDADQSALNGESKEARKYPQQIPGQAGDFLAKDQLFRGTVITGGEGVMRVDAVGDHTYYGRISIDLQQETRESPMQVRLAHLARLIARMGYIGAILVTLSYLLYDLVIANGFDGARILAELSNGSLMFEKLVHCAVLSMTVIVMAVPEGLPMMITVVLSANMKRMLKDNVLVRRMTGIETAGSLNMLFTDKTGTLTEGKLKVCAFVDAKGGTQTDLESVQGKPALWKLVYAGLTANNAAIMIDSEGKRRAVGGNATDRALLEAVDGMRQGQRSMPVLSAFPFDPANKFSATRVGGELQKTLIKGAPDKLLGACTSYVNAEGKTEPMDAAQRSLLERTLRQLGEKAIRVIALAMTDASVQGGTLPKGLVLVGFVGLRDQIRPEARDGVATAHKAGVQVVMITGDSRETAAAVAKECGIISDAKQLILTSAELNSMDDAEVSGILSKLRVVARALPQDKSRLVRLAQEQGLVVGMTGDGINDAPALKLADVGFAMGSGTEVAKEAGDIVILDDNFASINKAILYGRTIFKSIRKFIIFQLTINLCAVSLAVIGPFLGIETPITVLQMLWINMVMDTLAGLAFSGEPPLPEYMLQKPKKRDAPILNRYMIGQILFTGGYSMLASAFFLGSPSMRVLFGYGADPTAMLTGFFGLFMFLAIFNAFNARTHRLNLFSHLRQNRLFIAIMGLITLTQFLILYFGGPIFRTIPLPFGLLALVIAFAVSVIPVDLMRKGMLRLRHAPEDGV